jgi:DNA-binding IclR family transcriptional regulator
VPSSSASPSIHRLLEGPIDSFEKLELVLGLFHAVKPLSITELAHKFGLQPEETRGIVAELVRSNLVAVDLADGEEIVRIAPKDEDGAALNELARLYDEDRVLVVKTLSTIALDRIRGMAARTFADAFQLRKKKDRDDG